MSENIGTPITSPTWVRPQAGIAVYPLPVHQLPMTPALSDTPANLGVSVLSYVPPTALKHLPTLSATLATLAGTFVIYSNHP